MRALRTFAGTFVSSLKGQVRGYTLTGWAVTSTLSPILLLAGAWVALRLVSPDGPPSTFVAATGYPDYVAFVLLGVAFHGLATSALEDGGNAVYEEESLGTWDVIALAPFPRLPWMLAKTLAGLVSAFVDFFAVLAVGAIAFDRAPTPSGLLVALLGVCATLVALQGFAMLMAAFGLLWKQPWAIAFLLTPVLILLTGMMIPVSLLPGWLQPVANAIPLTHGLHIVREAILLDRGLAELAPAFGRLALTGGALMAIGFAAFRFFETKARESGVLGRY